MTTRQSRLRPKLPRRERLRTRDLEEMFYLVEDFRDFFAEELKARKEKNDKDTKEAVEKALKEKTYFAKKYSFGQTLLIVWVAHLVTTPVFFLLAWKLFG